MKGYLNENSMDTIAAARAPRLNGDSMDTIASALAYAMGIEPPACAAVCARRRSRTVRYSAL